MHKGREDDVPKFLLNKCELLFLKSSVSSFKN